MTPILTNSVSVLIEGWHEGRCQRCRVQEPGECVLPYQPLPSLQRTCFFCPPGTARHHFFMLSSQPPGKGQEVEAPLSRQLGLLGVLTFLSSLPAVPSSRALLSACTA